MQTYLFVGGQHHGKMLPVADETACPLRPSEGDRPYPGYRMSRLDLLGGGCRLFAIHESYTFLRERRDVYLTDALAVCLENHERVLRHFEQRRQWIPLNEVLDDEQGVPGRRKSYLEMPRPATAASASAPTPIRGADRV